MRPLAVASAVMAALMLLAAPLALAGGAENAEKGRAKAAEAKSFRHEGPDHDGRGSEAGEHDRSAKAEQRRTLLESFREAIRQWREAWKENATSIREACHAVAPDRENATREEQRAQAHCIRDGYRAFFEALRLERQSWKASWKGLSD